MKKLLLSLMLLASVVNAQKLDVNKPFGVVASSKHLSVKVMAFSHFDVITFGPMGMELKKIYGYNMGTGYFIGKGRILTEDHVTNGAEKILILRHGENEFEEAIMVTSSTAKDLSILSVNDDIPNGQVLFSTKYFPNQKVFAVGNAGADDFEVAEARIAGTSAMVIGDDNIRTAIHVDSKQKIRPGFSGGGLFDMNGALIGMVEATNGEGYAMAIRASEILDYLVEQGPDVHRSIINLAKRRK